MCASPAFRAINPIGKIPTLVFDDGRVLSESGAILFYLACDTALFPADRWDQANVHALAGSYGDYLLSKVSKVFPELARGV